MSSPPRPVPVHYNFAAADQLSQRLSQLAEKLEWLVWLRGSQRGTHLGAPTSDRWTGRKRDQFERGFTREQARLKALAARARELKATVDKATADAHAEQKAREAEAAKRYLDQLKLKP